MRRVARWTLRIVGALVVLVVLGGAAAAIFLHTDAGREAVRERVVQQLAKTFQGEVAIGALEGSPFGTLVARDVTITDAHGHPAIAIERVAIDIELTSLFRKRLSLPSVVADGVVLEARREPDGTWSLAHLLRPGPKSAWTVVIDSLVLRGRVAVDSGGEPIHVDDLVVAGALRASGDTLETSASIQGTWRERAAPISVIASAKRDAEWLAIPAIAVHAGMASLHAAGVQFDGATFTGTGFVRAPRDEVVRLARVDSLADIGLAFRARPATKQRFDDAVSRSGDDDALAGIIQAAPRSTGPTSNEFGDSVATKPVEPARDAVATKPVERQPLAERRDARDPSRATHVELVGGHGEAGVRGELEIWLAARRIAGALTGSDVDLALLSRERVPVVADGTVIVDATLGDRQLPAGHVVISALARVTGEYRAAPPTQLSSKVTSDGTRVRTELEARNPALVANASADLVIDGERVGLTGMKLTASAADLSRATGGLVPANGRLDLVADASGVVLPQPALAVTGRLDGRALRARDFTVETLALELDARRLPARPLGRLELVARGIDKRNDRRFALRELRLVAADRPDGAIRASLRTRPRHDPWSIDADALVRLGEVVTVDLQRHVVRAGTEGVWTGTTGRLAFARDRIELRDFASANGAASVALAGRIQRTGRRAGDLAAHAVVEQLALSQIDPRMRGRVDAKIEVERRAGQLVGDASFTATCVTKCDLQAVKTIVVPVDACGTVRFDARALAADVYVDGKSAGAARVRIDIDAPNQPQDLRAWRRLDRSAIRVAQVDLAKIDLAKIAGDKFGGTIDGQLRVDGGVPSGRIEVRQASAPQLRDLGKVEAELVVARTVSSGPVEDIGGEGPARLAMGFVPDPRDGVGVSVMARLDTIGKLEAKAELRIPDRVFDPAQWRRLDRHVLRRATVSARDLMFDPAQLQQLGIVATARGRVSLDAEIVPDRATVTARVHELRGSAIARPVNIEARATIDDTRAVADLAIASPTTRMIDVRAEVPLGFEELIEELIDAPEGLRATPVTATARLNAPARVLLGTFGRTEVVGGWLEGKVEVRGTVAEPTATIALLGTDIQVPPGPGGKPIRTVRRLAVDGTWRGGGGKLALDATQDGGSLKLAMAGDLDRPDETTLSLVANSFDLVPLLVFAPGPAGGAAGRLDANVTVKGVDPATATIAGEVHLLDARVPLAPSVGTLRRAKIDLVVDGPQVRVAVDGRLGGGSVKANGAISLAGATPSAGNLTLALRDVRPIGAVEPQIDADVTATVRRARQRWLADVAVRNATVKVPSSRGQPLAPAGAPPDMVFVNGERITRRPLEKAPPEEPMIVANIALAPTRIESEELRGTVRGTLTVTADGESLGIVGTIEADRGDLDLFGRRYRAERAVVRFDGSTDPLLDVALVHEFPDVVTTTQIRGRMSKPQLTLTSNPGTYSQGQLLGFLLGGEPSGGDPGGAGDRATSAGASLLANRIGGFVRRSLPLDLDVLRYEGATATSSAAITVGTWLSHDLFLAYRQRLEARPDENSGEGELEYWLFRRVVIESVVGDRGRHAVDLLWRKRY